MSGEMDVGMGIHRGGGAAAKNASANGSARGSAMTSGASSRRASSRRPSAYLANGITPKEAEAVTAALAKANASNRAQPMPASKQRPSVMPVTPAITSADTGTNGGIPRSASSCLLQLPEGKSTKSCFMYDQPRHNVMFNLQVMVKEEFLGPPARELT